MTHDRTILQDLIERLFEIVQSDEHDCNIREFVEAAARDAKQLSERAVTEAECPES